MTMKARRSAEPALRSWWTTGVVGMSVVALAACGAPAPPRPVPTPDVVWVDGPPDGPLEDDPWVAVVRAGIVAQMNAWNSAVFTDDALIDLWTEEAALEWSDRAALALKLRSAEVFLGPTPFTPLEVRVADDQGSAVVVGCQDSTPQKTRYSSGRTRDDRPHAYWLEKNADGHMYIVGSGSPGIGFALDDGRELTEELCADIPIKEGRFDPPPSLDDLMQLGPEDVLAPQPRSPLSDE